MAKHRTTLKDIAEQLGVTITTVSKALKDYPDISDETKKAVKKLARKLHYQPDSRALALRKNKSNTIGVIVPEIVHYFFSNVIAGIMASAEENGYRVLITLSDNKKALEKKQVNLLFNTKVDGVLVSLANQSKNAKHFNMLREFGIPLVMFDKIDERYQCSKVSIDDERGAYQATSHLIAQGCKRIAHIRGPKHPLNSKARFNGYKRALTENGLEQDRLLLKVCEKVTLKEGYDLALELLQSENPPDGIFAITDQVGVGVVQAAKSCGIKVPEELKVVGFSDSQVAQIVDPSLTTIHQPSYEIGERATTMLIEEIEMKGDSKEEDMLDFRHVILDTYLIQRNST